VAAAVLLVLLRWVVPTVAPESSIAGMPLLFIGVFAALILSLVIILWWSFLSRAPWRERLAALAILIAAVAATRLVVHPSIAGGMMGMLFFVFGLPMAAIGFVAWAVASRRFAAGLPRAAALVATLVLACLPWALVRTGGITGEADSDFHWRWTPSPEERLLARSDASTALPAPAPAQAAKPAEDRAVPPTSVEPAAAAATVATAAGAPAPSAASAEAQGSDVVAVVAQAPAGASTASAATPSTADWPGFRGPQRDGIVHGGVRIATDWAASPPVELWRRPVGPGWSSFAVRGDLLYTQEQRGDEEVISCYKVSTGEPVWGHRDAARFWESNGGTGPRGTPTLHEGRVYALGATGILNALDANSGAVLWSRNAAADTKTEVPGWGFSSSPLVFEDVVIVAVEGTLAAYDLRTGAPRWTGPKGRGSYSSPHLSTIGGVRQVLLLSGSEATSVAPADGALLWKHKGLGGGNIVQPALTADGDVLVGTMEGVNRVAVARGAGGWAAQDRWTSIGLKPYFNDFVIHEGHAYGFDGRMLAAIDLADGKRKWKGGRYGAGQLVLLADQDLLVVLSEEGELALVRAVPGEFTELARFPAIQGKTWNHPVLAGNVLLVRNGEEMAAFRLAPAGG
jgi:outer membrane protein assembly factor BamB